MPFPPRKSAKPPKRAPTKAGAQARPEPKAARTAKPARPRRAPPGSGRRGGTTVLHTCGHKEGHAFTGPKWKKAKDAEWQKGRPCTACWSLRQAEDQEASCAVPDLPDLAGAVRQVSWARSLRAAAIAQARLAAWRMDQERRLKGLEPAMDRYLALVLPPLLAKTDAGWWIDHRESDPLELVLDFQAQDALEELRQEAAQAVACPF
jgi:hypothetical protein